MNSESLYADRDMGKDGNNVVGNCNKYFAKDAFGFSLGYHNSDYTPINASATFLADKTGSDLLASTTNLYNGNISSMVTTITTPVAFVPEPSFEILAQSNAYTYDRLNRLRESKSFANLDYDNNLWMNSGNPYDGRYHNQFTYNANGGMLTALAKNAMGETIDNQTYHRATTTNGRYINNRTYAITDVATQTSGEDLLDQQAFDNTVLSNNNYGFTEIGERNKNLSEDIESITWTVYGKKAGVKRTATSGKNNVTFNYDPQNNRIAKHVYTSDDIWINSEYYVRDAQGNLMATYRLEASSGSGLSYELTERHIYGSNSIGINTTPVEMIGANTPTDTYPHVIGDKRFNGSNHLNNVLSVFTDKKLPLDVDNNGIIDGYLPQVISANDYAPFGSRLSERTFNKELYPNSFNGKRESAELDGEQDYGERDYNPKEREFDKDDPLITQEQKYPELSPYQYASNTPIWAVDIDGLEAFSVHGTWSNPNTFSALKNENYQTIKEIFGNKSIGKKFTWSAKNLDSDRREAASLLVSQIKSQMKDGEPITVIGHSHGGNVGVLAVNMMSEDEDFAGKEINLITINTPVREDYQLTDVAKDRVNHYNIFDKADPVQKRGGNNPAKFVDGNKRVETGERRGLKLTGEFGKAGRQFDNAYNIKTTKSHGIFGNFHNSHNKPSEWKDNLKKSVENKNKKDE